MMNSETILPDSIAIQNDIAALDVAIKKYLDTIFVESLLVYNIDQVYKDALPALAEQFDVLGYKGMRLAQTEADKRNVIKRAIELHRYKGTPWAVKEAMKSVGFTDAVIFEHVAGPSPIWANFSVLLVNAGVGITVDTISDLTKMIEEYKNARSNLVEIFMELLLDDEIDFDDDIVDYVEHILIDDSLVFSSQLFYDGVGNYDGLFDHSGDSDVVTWT